MIENRYHQLDASFFENPSHASLVAQITIDNWHELPYGETVSELYLEHCPYYVIQHLDLRKQLDIGFIKRHIKQFDIRILLTSCGSLPIYFIQEQLFIELMKVNS